MEENEAAIQAALKSDVGKPGFEATFTEIVPVQVEIRQMLDEIDHWMRPQSCPTPAALLPGSSYIMRDPYGVVLIVAPFNYPIQLTMLPLIAAISAGNCAILKPSELTPASTALLLELLPKYLDTSAFQIVTGGVAETTALLKEKVSDTMTQIHGHVRRSAGVVCAVCVRPLTYLCLRLFLCESAPSPVRFHLLHRF